MPKLETLQQLVARACPDWVIPPQTDDPKAFLQGIIDQVLPGQLGIHIDRLDEREIFGSVPHLRSSANVAGLMHGATIFALGDTLAGALLWSMSDGSYYGVSANCSIVYLRPVPSGTLRCRVYESRRTKERAHFVAQFTSDSDQRIGRLRMEYAIIPL